MRLLITILCVLAALGLRAQPDAWLLRADQVDPAKYYGITVANGMLGLVSSAEPLQIKTVVLAGAYDQYGRGRVSNFVRSFNLLNMNLDIDGQRLNSSNIRNFRQELDMRHAAFTTTFEVGDKANITYTYRALRHLPFCGLLDVSIKAKQDLSLTAASVIEAPDALRDVQNYYDEIDRPHVTFSLLTSSARSPTGKLAICASTSFIFTEASRQEPAVIHEARDSNLHSMKFRKQLAAGQTYSFAVVGTAITSAHHADPLNEAERLTAFARLEGRERLLAAHNRAWDALWQSDVEVVGDPQAQQDLHSMLYHLYSFVRAGTALSVSPMGLSGLGYNGHIFADADVWLVPVLLALHPELARSLLDYRFERLEAARRNARAHGYAGAMFPWESAETGEEETPVWALSGPFEHHISADVALAAWNYYCVTQNKTWLRERGWPLLAATADFWVSRVERNGPGHYDIKNVVALDEWAENVDNDAFTNAAAQANLRHAAAAARLLGLPVPPDWQEVAQNIPILHFPDGTTKEHATYAGESIKQADVTLLAYPLGTIADPARIRRDLAYYETRAPAQGTPAMTQSITALLYARLGDGAKAHHFFQEAYLPNLAPPFRTMAEFRAGPVVPAAGTGVNSTIASYFVTSAVNPYFMTGAAGVLEATLMGFGGLNITPTGFVQLKSALPPTWKSLKITGVGTGRRTYTVVQ